MTINFLRGQRHGWRTADRRARALASLRAIQATVNVLLVASGRWPEKRGL